MVPLVVGFIVTWVICGIVCGIVASSKGRDPTGWFFIGLILGIFGMFLIALLPAVNTTSSDSFSGWNASNQDHSTFPSNAATIQRASALPESKYDKQKWNILKEVDAEIAATAARIIALDPVLEDMLAEKFITLNDKSYLASIERHIADKFLADRKLFEEQTANLEKGEAESSQREMQDYRFAIQGTGQFDPKHNLKVTNVEPYVGSWVSFRGGIKITFDDGSVLLKKGHLGRTFKWDDKSLI